VPYCQKYTPTFLLTGLRVCNQTFFFFFFDMSGQTLRKYHVPCHALRVYHLTCFSKKILCRSAGQTLASHFRFIIMQTLKTAQNKHIIIPLSILKFFGFLGNEEIIIIACLRNDKAGLRKASFFKCLECLFKTTKILRPHLHLPIKSKKMDDTFTSWMFHSRTTEFIFVVVHIGLN